jgi:hypothetical protein
MTYPSISICGLLLEAEVAANVQSAFETQYTSATGTTVSPATTDHYQSQANKWGAELRIYFNDANLASALTGSGVAVENRSGGYLSDQYAYRINNNDLWWHLVENLGASLGHN